MTGSKQGVEKTDQSDIIAEEHYRVSKGLVIDKNDVERYTDDPDAYQGEWPIYDCAADQLEKI